MEGGRVNDFVDAFSYQSVAVVFRGEKYFSDGITMKGNSLNEFMNDLYSMGGPEKEFLYKDKRYFLQCEAVDNNMIEMVIFQCFGKQEYIFRYRGKSFSECVEAFEKAKIFDGKTIYEAEKDIEVLFG